MSDSAPWNWQEDKAENQPNRSDQVVDLSFKISCQCLHVDGGEVFAGITRPHYIMQLMKHFRGSVMNLWQDCIWFMSPAHKTAGCARRNLMNYCIFLNALA